MTTDRPAPDRPAPDGPTPGRPVDLDRPVEVDGHLITLRHLDKVLYPATGMTKGEVLAYYAQVAPALLAQLADRPVTRRRWPDGMGGPSFYEKNVPRGAPDWIRRVTLPAPGSASERVTYPVIDSLAALMWSANLAAIELHVPQWRVGPRGGVRGPDRLVVDLDPGPPAGLVECARVAFAVRELLADDGLEGMPVTSGGKGMQVYAALSARQDPAVVRAYAERLAGRLARVLPDLVVVRMTKSLRPGKVLVDWSQNHPAKTTVAPYSLRGVGHAGAGHPPAGHPGAGGAFAAAPRRWEELADPRPVQLSAAQVVARLDTLGDLLAPLAAPGPRLPR